MTDRLLPLLLRVFGTSSLLATIFVAAPHAWMRDIHVALGLGAFPDTPVVWYLARSTSALYAVLGGLFWVVSFDLVRYRPVVRYLAGVLSLFGVALGIIDWAEGLPLFWTLWEGPVVLAFGLTVLTLSRHIEATPGHDRARD
jgi:hypothetical protein